MTSTVIIFQAVSMYKIFIKMCSTLYHDEFLRYSMELRDESIEAAYYVERVNPETYSNAYFPLPRYGNTTSNPVESINSLFVKERQLRYRMIAD